MRRALQSIRTWQLNKTTPVLFMTLLYFTTLPSATSLALNRPPRSASNKGVKQEKGPMRANRALRATHSRRATDRIIKEGRLTVNGEVVVSSDLRLRAGDLVTFDGSPVVWDELELDATLGPHRHFKYYKPAGVVCTMDPRRPHNLAASLVAVGRDPFDGRRIYPVGRLDAESTGLLLLTSNGDCLNSLLRAEGGKQKEYHVVTTPRASDDAVRVLAAGVEITAPANVAGKVEDVTAVTRPCVVARLTPEQKEWKSNSVNDNNNSISGCGSSTITDIDDDRNVGDDENGLLFVLEEGRNRQIRRMCAAMGLNVDSLHRTSFAGITLDAATENPGAWAALSHEEELLMGARMAPTREELRSPEERAERKAKKMAKKLQKGKFL